VERIRCPAPLPEDSADAVLTRMLAPTPYQVPMKEGENRETRDDPCSEDNLDTASGETKVSSPKDKGAGEVNIPSPHGKKRAASEDWEEKSPKRGKMPSSGGSGLASDVVAQCHHEDRPPAKS
jgi:hypothetical protein